jgi:hypothetical protein
MNKSRLILAFVNALRGAKGVFELSEKSEKEIKQVYDICVNSENLLLNTFAILLEKFYNASEIKVKKEKSK